MPLQLVRLFKRKKRPESNIFQIDPSDESSGRSLIQTVQGSQIGNVNGPMFSNNQITTIHNHHPTREADDAEYQDYAELKLRDIILGPEFESEFESSSRNVHHDLQPDGTLVEIGRTRQYTGHLFKNSNEPMLIRKYEGTAVQDWKRELNALSRIRHPNIIQLYGLSRSSHFMTLVFHSFNGGNRITVPEYHMSLSGISFLMYIPNIVKQYFSAAHELRRNDIQPASGDLQALEVNSSGHLVINNFDPRNPYGMPVPDVESSIDHASGDSNDPDLIYSISAWFKTRLFDKLLLAQYYGFIVVAFGRLYWQDSSCSNFSIHHKGTTTILRVPKPSSLKLTVLWFNPTWDIQCFLDNMSLRCALPTSKIRSLDWDQALMVQVQPDHQLECFSLFSVWASQVYYLIKNMGLAGSNPETSIPSEIQISCQAQNRNLVHSAPSKLSEKILQHEFLYLWFDCRRPHPDNTHWSTDIAGIQIIPKVAIEDAFDVDLHITSQVVSYKIPQFIYPLLREIHAGCGFDPDSTEMADYLGYPLLEPISGEFSDEDFLPDI
ncbi:hypothetical protein C8J56DRAFT_931695 [Mycena floridula]|nr:hypothetical protein C8J56DRAFT_931695 [Mycena floridula]